MKNTFNFNIFRKLRTISFAEKDETGFVNAFKPHHNNTIVLSKFFYEDHKRLESIMTFDTDNNRLYAIKYNFTGSGEMVPVPGTLTIEETPGAGLNIFDEVTEYVFEAEINKSVLGNNKIDDSEYLFMDELFNNYITNSTIYKTFSYNENLNSYTIFIRFGIPGPNLINSQFLENNIHVGFSFSKKVKI